MLAEQTLEAEPEAVVRPTWREARALVAYYGSPLYVYDLDEVGRRFRRFAASFPYAPVDFHYAIVCNKNHAIVERLQRLGCGIHANTPGDAYAALAAGVPSERIVYSGTNLGRDDLAFLLERRIALNVDSLDQVRDVLAHDPRNRLGIRVLIDDPRKRNRIGLDPAEVRHAVRLAAAHGGAIVGLHMYAGTNTLRETRHLQCLDRLLEVADDVPDLEYVDVGGGYGIGYREDEDDLGVDQIGARVALRLERLSARLGRRIRLVVEPGRALVATAGTLIVSVVSVKERGGRRYVGVDSTVGNIVVPSIYHAHHRVEVLADRGPALSQPTDVCGNTTHSGDYLARNLHLPEVHPGDLLALRDVGAYAYAMSSHFLNRPRPAEVVLEHGAVVLTTRREALSDLLALQQR